MISDKLLKKLEKTVSKMDMTRLSEISIMQDRMVLIFCLTNIQLEKITIAI